MVLGSDQPKAAKKSSIPVEQESDKLLTSLAFGKHVVSDYEATP
jgi:hypothetical protein